MKPPKPLPSNPCFYKVEEIPPPSSYTPLEVELARLREEVVELKTTIQALHSTLKNLTLRVE